MLIRKSRLKSQLFIIMKIKGDSINEYSFYDIVLGAICRLG